MVLRVKNPYYTLSNNKRRNNKKMINVDFVKLKDAYNNIKKDQKLTQADLSKRCGWSKNAFGMFLNEKTPLNEKNLIKICNALEISAADVCENLAYGLKQLTYKYKISGLETPYKEVNTVSEADLRILIYGDIEKKIMWDGKPWVIPVGVHYICTELEKNERLQASKQKMVIVRKGKNKFEVVEACQAIKLDCDYRFYLIGLAFPKFAPNKD